MTGSKRMSVARTEQRPRRSRPALKQDAQLTLGKQSRSNTAACSSWPNANGCSIQLPHHHGLARFMYFAPLDAFSQPQTMPPSSAAFQPNSSARNKAYMATDTRSCWAGYTPSARPARDAPTAGA